MNAAVGTLEQLAKTDPAVAPLALLRAEALRSSSSPVWASAIPGVDGWDPATGRPLLFGARLRVDRAAAGALFGKLFALARPRAAGALGAMPDPLVLLEASIRQDAHGIMEIAAKMGVGEGLIAAVGEQLALPLLEACGRSAEPLLKDGKWDRGFCPVCGAWPTLAEVRGAERERWLRCGRCGAGWRRLHFTCVFCGNRDHATQGYLAPEAAMEARQATTCERCRGYLKSVASPFALDTGELFLKDLATVELDVAAIQRGYSRPATPGYALKARIDPA